MSRVTVCILYQGWSRFSCASRRLCSLPASWNQSCLPLQGTRMFFFKAPAPARILPLPNSLFLKLQYCAPGQRFFSRHHWSVCSSVVPTFPILFHFVFQQFPVPSGDAATSCILSSQVASVHMLFCQIKAGLPTRDTSNETPQTSVSVGGRGRPLRVH